MTGESLSCRERNNAIVGKLIRAIAECLLDEDQSTQCQIYKILLQKINCVLGQF